MTTPSQTVGPFFALGLPWEDGPFVVAEDAPGAIALRGRVLDGAGEPVPDALVETWQADPDGRFDHPDDPRGRVARLPRLRPLPDRRRRELADRHAQARAGARRRTACRRRRTSPSRCSRAACSTASSRGSTSATSPRRTPPTRCSRRLGAAQRATLIAAPADGGYVLDLHLQGERETAFLRF